MRENVSLLAFNRGLVSALGLARADIKRMAMAAETYVNWMPRVLGSMMLRPGLRYIGSTLSNLTARFLPFIFSVSDKAKIELTANIMRIWLDDTVITRPSVSTAVTNGTFDQWDVVVTMTSANPGVFTYTGADFFAEGDAVSFTTTGALPTAIGIGTKYYVKVGTLNVGANTFQIATTPTGTAIDTTAGVQSGVHTIYAYYYITGWTDTDEATGAVSEAVTTYDSGLTGGTGLQLAGDGTNAAMRSQELTVAAGDLGVEHGIRIIVARGPVGFKAGSIYGAEDYVSLTDLDEGVHSLSITPTTNIFIEFVNRKQKAVVVTSIAVEAAGTMQVTTPWAAADLPYIKYDQSGDILFCACPDIQQYKIERRATRSWSVVKYFSDDGPFDVLNVSTMTMQPSVLTGNGWMYSSMAKFKSTDVGSLIAITSTGQIVQSVMTGTTSTSSIKVEGTGTERTFNYVIDFSGVGTTVILQKSFDDATWVAVAGASWTADTSGTLTDGLDNQTVYYRLTCTVYATQVNNAELSTSAGSKRGVCRLLAYSNTLTMAMEVLEPFGGTTASENWEQSLWSSRKGWPTAVCFNDGRLWWFGKDRVIGSISDGFYSFTPLVEGDSGVINRQLGGKAVDTVNWGLSLQRLIVGGEMAEYSCRSTSFDEPLTPTNFNVKHPSTQGSNNAQAIAVDDKGIFVQRGGVKVFELSMDGGALEYTAQELTALVPEIGEPSIVRIVEQRQPDTRIHVLRSDGTVAMLLYDKLENVLCWIEIETTGGSGFVEDILIMPGGNGTVEDEVFYLVRRTINGSTVRYLEQWATEASCQGGSSNKQADSFIVSTGSVITGLSHLEGEQVVVWADGADVGYDANDALIYTVSGGQITLTAGYTNVIVGLPYTAQWQSGKLVQLAGGQALKHTKQIKGLGVILKNTHHKGLKFGQDFTTMDDLPSMESGTAVATGTIHGDYDETPFSFPGNWTTDSRLCLQAKAPRPCTILAAICDMEYH